MTTIHRHTFLVNHAHGEVSQRSFGMPTAVIMRSVTAVHLAVLTGRSTGSLSTRRSAVSYLLGCGTVTVQLTFGFTPM